MRATPPMRHPASLDFARAVDGIMASSNRIRRALESCPDTQIILGGYSQGAAVNAYVTLDRIPDGLALAPAAAFAGKTLDLCAPRDRVCEAGGLDRAAHSLYAVNGMADQAATEMHDKY